MNIRYCIVLYCKATQMVGFYFIDPHNRIERNSIARPLHHIKWLQSKCPIQVRDSSRQSSTQSESALRLSCFPLQKDRSKHGRNGLMESTSQVCAFNPLQPVPPILSSKGRHERQPEFPMSPQLWQFAQQ